MVQSVESRIHKLLLEHRDSLKVADLLLKDWESGQLAWIEQESVGHFLIQCGFLRAYFDQIVKVLKAGKKVPWSSFAEALAQSKIKLSKEEFDQLFIGAGEEQSLSDLVKCTGLDAIDGRFQKIRENMDHSVIRAEKTPSPPEPLDEAENLSDFSLLSEAPEPNGLVEKIKARVQNRDSDLVEKMNEIFQKALNHRPDQEKEAAIALGMVGAWSKGLEILRKAKPSFQRSLLELEFLIQGGRFVEAFELSEKMLTQSPSLQQKGYIQFVQAQALVELRRPIEAQKILENLILENPNHTSARTLLNEIRSEAK